MSNEVLEKENESVYSLIDPQVEKTFSYEQRIEIRKAIAKGLKRQIHSKKLLEYRVRFKLLKNFYLVILLGEDRRKTPRNEKQLAFFTKYLVLSAIAAVVFFILILVLLVVLYLLKSLARIDLFNDYHLSDLISEIKNLFG